MAVNTHRREYTTLYCSSVDDPLSPQPLFTTPPSEHVIDEELFLRALWEEDSEDDDAEADPVRDDLYFRRVQQTLHQTSTNPSYDRFLPQYWTPEEETRVRRIYLGSQRRPWYHKMQSLSHKALAFAEEFDFDLISWHLRSATEKNISATSGEPPHYIEEILSKPEP
ncbi:LIM domain only protein 7-like [Stegastes partitus]|uniref:LIM domain only protein 7-like n=1 Tax=Stegastes partitus TaxID=144197 RepID=A0A9Y4NAY9_9TELE|nr:PREDICTED: LIM domain only protein 7-like [Stegastes partitus]